MSKKLLSGILSIAVITGSICLGKSPDTNTQGETNMDKKKTQKAVKEAYGSIAKKSRGGCGCSCGCNADPEKFAESIGYTEQELKNIPPESNLALSCGNPTAFASLKKGETILDLGSGAGFDCFIAAKKVGPTGKVIGVDMTPEMIEKANANIKKYKIKNVEFKLGEIENLPIADNSVDVIISNCVINLSTDKAKVFKEAYRVLKNGGRIAFSDMALKKELPKKIRQNMAAYVGCISGAILIEDYRKMVETAGLKEVKTSIKGTSNCITNAKDPLNTNLEGKESIADSVVSIYVEGHK